MVEAARGRWRCPALVDIPYPSGRSPWTSGTVRGQRQGGGCSRQSVPPLSGRTRPRRALTASRSTSQKPKLDSEHTIEGFPPHLLTPLHPNTNLSVSLSPVLDLLRPIPLTLLLHFYHFTNHDYKVAPHAHLTSNDGHFSVLKSGRFYLFCFLTEAST